MAKKLTLKPAVGPIGRTANGKRPVYEIMDIIATRRKQNESKSDLKIGRAHV